MKLEFGHYIAPETEPGEYLKISFRPGSFPLQQRWRNNGLSADFLADYVSNFFPGEDPTTNSRQVEIRDAVSFIANELLENAMKFSVEGNEGRVSIEMFLEANVISLYTHNTLEEDTVEGFQKYIEQLLTEDVGELYIAQLERNAESEEEGGSGLGFLTMLHDYGAEVAWKFQREENQVDDGVMIVSTMVRLAI